MLSPNNWEKRGQIYLSLVSFGHLYAQQVIKERGATLRGGVHGIADEKARAGSLNRSRRLRRCDRNFTGSETRRPVKKRGLFTEPLTL